MNVSKVLVSIGLFIGLLSAGCGAAQGGDQPAPASWSGDVPVGMYFMSRYISGSGLEKSCWYWAPDGTVYEGLMTGFSDQDLADHPGRKGKARAEGGQVVIDWGKGGPTKSPVEKDKSGFMFDMGSFTPVTPIADPASVAGSYEGGESLVHGGNSVGVGKTLDLKSDGTFARESAAYVSGKGDGTKLSGGASSAGAGKWSVAGWTMTLDDGSGKPSRLIAFPYDDPDAKAHPAHLYVGGTLYKHR